MSDLSFWDDVSAAYDRWYASPVGEAIDRAEKAAAARLLPRAATGQRLVEVGCGTGHWSEWFAGRGWRVTGVDLSRGMLETAEARGIPGAEFAVGDARALPFEDETFDVAAAVAALEFLGDGPGAEGAPPPAAGRAELALAEMVRVVRPGGTVLVGLLNRLSPLNRMRRAGGGEPWSSARLFSPAEARALLAPCGRARIDVCAFGPHDERRLAWAPVVEWLGRALRRRTGAMVFAAARLG